RLLLSTTLVDFGDAAENNSFGTSWTTVYKGPYTGYDAAGPDGISGGSTGIYHTAGVSGAAARQFNVGDQVVVTWYNNSASSQTFTPKISFDDLDYEGSGDAGTWYTLSQMTIPAGQSATATYTFTSSGSYYNVNTARNTNNISNVLIDKIELIENTTVSIAATDASAAEPSNTGTYTVTRDGSTSGALTVNYTVSGTATNGTDYSSLSGSVVIPDGQASATITVTPTDDSADEASETVIVTLASGSGYAIGSPSSDTVNIADDDPTITSLVNLGDSAGNNTFGTSWTTVFLGNYTGYDAAGPDGTMAGYTGTTNVVRVSGASNRTFAVGDQVVATWYNTSASQITFTPKVSFTDTNEWDSSSTWYNMNQVTIAAYGTATSTYTVDAGSAGDRALVNVCRYTAGVNAALLDKIELYTNDAPASPSVTISATDASAAEPSDTGTYTVTRSGSTSGALAVNYTISGTATNGTDYSTLSGSVTIPDGQASATITLTPTDDASIESTETAILTLATGSGYTIGSPNAATVNLADNDVYVVTISATDSSAAEPSSTGTYTVTRSGGTSGALAVNYTVSGTATNGTDYTSLSGTVTIPDGQAGATITLTPTNDSTVESTETAILTLASGTGYSIGSPSAATVNIADNDSTVTIVATDAAAAEPSNTGTFTVTRSGYTGADLTVNLSRSGTAANGTDYNSIGTTVTIPNGQSSATITVTPIDDATTESTETVILTLSSGTDYAIGSPNSATVNITDNDSGFGVTGVSGIVNARQTITISGDSFGSGPDAVVFDDFEDGALDTPINYGPGSAFVGQWDNTGSNTTYSDDDSISGNQAFRG
ncbi:MAG: hypothetical protein EHM48_05235, partial [Planctomycetaceae bacterium]